VGYLISALLQITAGEKNFENRLAFGKVTDKSIEVPFFPDMVYASLTQSIQ